MGWFAVAAVFGFLLFWTWRNLLRHELQDPDSCLGAVFGPALPVFAAALLAVVLLGWAWFAADRGLSIFDVIGRGTVARGLLGVVVGFGLGYAIEHRILLAASAKASKKGAGDKSGAPVGGTSALLTVGLGAVILALASPHLDNWLSHLTSLKSPIIELQLGSVASHKVSVTEGAVAYQDAISLNYLATYNRAIADDIEYIEKFDSKNSHIVPAKELLPAFEYLISPIAGCVKTAMNNGLGIDSARQMIRPIVDNISRLIFNEDNTDAAAQHEMFWKQLQALPEAVKHFLKKKQTDCLDLPKKYQTCMESAQQHNSGDCLKLAQKYPGGGYPKFRDYKNMPYLHVAAAYLFSFMTDDDTALRILRDAERDMGLNKTPTLVFKDYGFLMTAGRLSYYLGKPGALNDSYFGYLDKMREVSNSHVNILKAAFDACTDADCKDKMQRLLIRDWMAELDATNNLTYYLAEDLARDSPSAASYRARAGEYAVQLERAVTEGIKRKAINKYYHIDDEDQYYYIDTYSYMNMVLEAGKTNPDVEKFKKLKNEFQRVVEHIEEVASNIPNIKKNDLTLIKVLRAHLASARELAGE